MIKSRHRTMRPPARTRRATSSMPLLVLHLVLAAAVLAAAPTALAQATIALANSDIRIQIADNDTNIPPGGELRIPYEITYSVDRIQDEEVTITVRAESSDQADGVTVTADPSTHTVAPGDAGSEGATLEGVLILSATEDAEAYQIRRFTATAEAAPTTTVEGSQGLVALEAAVDWRADGTIVIRHATVGIPADGGSDDLLASFTNRGNGPTKFTITDVTHDTGCEIFDGAPLIVEPGMDRQDHTAIAVLCPAGAAGGAVTVRYGLEHAVERVAAPDPIIVEWTLVESAVGNVDTTLRGDAPPPTRRPSDGADDLPAPTEQPTPGTTGLAALAAVAIAAFARRK